MICKYGIPYKPGEPLPLKPGDTVYEIATYSFYEIREHTIHGVAVYHDHCRIILDGEIFPIVTDCSLSEIDRVFFLTYEDAENWKKNHLSNPPYPICDCTRWVSPQQFIPDHESHSPIYVKLQTPDGIIKVEAYYDDGSPYPEDKGFWDGTGRHSKKLDNVVAWIGDESWDPEESDDSEDDDETEET